MTEELHTLPVLMVGASQLQKMGQLLGGHIWDLTLAIAPGESGENLDGQILVSKPCAGQFLLASGGLQQLVWTEDHLLQQRGRGQPCLRSAAEQICRISQSQLHIPGGRKRARLGCAKA